MASLIFRCEAGDHYGLGHVMRVRAMLHAIHLLAPRVQCRVMTTTLPVCNVLQTDRWVDVSLFSEAAILANAVYEKKVPVVVDMPFGCPEDRIRCTTQPIVRIDAPWATPVNCDGVILPGIHHDAQTIHILQEMFEPFVLHGKDYIVLPNKMPLHAERQDYIAFTAGGTDPYGLLERCHTICGESQWCRYLVGNAIKGVAKGWTEPFSMQVIAESALCVCAWGITVYECLVMHVPVCVVTFDEPTFREASTAQRAEPGVIRAVVRFQDIVNMLPALLSRCIGDAKVASPIDTYGSRRCAQAILSWTGLAAE